MMLEFKTDVSDVSHRKIHSLICSYGTRFKVAASKIEMLCADLWLITRKSTVFFVVYRGIFFFTMTFLQNFAASPISTSSEANLCS